MKEWNKKKQFIQWHQQHRKKPKKIKLVSLCYIFSGINLMVFDTFVLGIIFLWLAISIYTDTRKERYDEGAVLCGCFIHAIVTMLCAWYYSSWWLMVLYVIEVLIFIYAASSGT